MWSVRSCRNCSVRGIPCDGNKPTCTPCQLSGAAATFRCAQEYGTGRSSSSGATVTNATGPAAGAAAATLAAAAATAGRRSGAAEKRRDPRSLVKRSSFTDTVPDGDETATCTTTNDNTPLTLDPVPSQYRETQLIFDGINYCKLFVIPAPLVPTFSLLLRMA